MRIHRLSAFMLIFALPGCGPKAASGGTSGDASGTDDSLGQTDELGEPGTDESDTQEPTTTVFLPMDGPLCGGGGFRCTATCEIHLQDCPEGEKCTPYASAGGTWDDEKCVPILGDIGPGGSCNYNGPVEATDDCDATSMCLGGVCRSFCSGVPEEPVCPADLACAATSDEDPLPLCLEACDPLAQDCDEGSCLSTAGGFVCVPSGEAMPGQPCLHFNDCAGGNICADADVLPTCDDGACCTPLCNLDQPDCAGLPGTECVAWYEPGEAPAGLELVGVCLTP